MGFALRGRAAALSSWIAQRALGLRASALAICSPPAAAGGRARRVRVNHVSLYARDPAKAAADLAYLVGGEAHQIGPLKSCGQWVCFLNPPGSLNLLDPDATDFVEMIPRTKRLKRSEDGRAAFEDYDSRSEKSAGVHLNLSVPATRGEIQQRAQQRGLNVAWRGYLPGVDVWLEEDPALLVELAPPLETLTGSVGKWS